MAILIKSRMHKHWLKRRRLFINFSEKRACINICAISIEKKTYGIKTGLKANKKRAFLYSYTKFMLKINNAYFYAYKNMYT
jgi:hypothetical protein